MFNHSDATLEQQVDQLANLITTHQKVTVLTGAGISVSAGIPDLEMLTNGNPNLMYSNASLEANPTQFWQNFHHFFVDPIFTNGPTISHRVLAALEKEHYVTGLVTTNIDYLHELAGSHATADIWSSFNINHCLQCGRIFDIDALKAPIPRCPVCGGLISPDPVFRNIATLPAERAKADQWMATSDLTIVIGCNGYYSHTSDQAVVNINPKANTFDRGAALSIHTTADQVLARLEKVMHLSVTK